MSIRSKISTTASWTGSSEKQPTVGNQKKRAEVIKTSDVPIEVGSDIAINQLVDKLDTVKEIPEKIKLIRNKVKSIACT